MIAHEVPRHADTDCRRYIDCLTPETSEAVADLLRGLRTHGGKLLKGLQDGDVERAQLGLGHAYSRSKVKFSVNRLVSFLKPRTLLLRTVSD